MSTVKYSLPRTALSENKLERRAKLDEYFPSGLIPFEKGDGDEWEVHTFEPIDPSYYVDPELGKMLSRWQHPVNIESISHYYSIYKNCQLSFFDSWSLYYWSLVLNYLKSKDQKPSHITIIHVDDHKDLYSPHLAQQNNEYQSIFSKAPFALYSPSTVAECIREKSVGIDSFITPLFFLDISLSILHLQYSCQKESSCYLKLNTDSDPLFGPKNQRFKLSKTQNFSKGYYLNSADPEKILSQIHPEGILFLHIDCDGFSNRYNLDSSWSPEFVSIDMSLSQIKHCIDLLFEGIKGHEQEKFMNIALSPGFFPSELWEITIDYLLTKGEETKIINENGFSAYVNENKLYEFKYSKFSY